MYVWIRVVASIPSGIYVLSVRLRSLTYGHRHRCTSVPAGQPGIRGAKQLPYSTSIPAVPRFPATYGFQSSSTRNSGTTPTRCCSSHVECPTGRIVDESIQKVHPQRVFDPPKEHWRIVPCVERDRNSCRSHAPPEHRALANHVQKYLSQALWISQRSMRTFHKDFALYIATNHNLLNRADLTLAQKAHHGQDPKVVSEARVTCGIRSPLEPITPCLRISPSMDLTIPSIRRPSSPRIKPSLTRSAMTRWP